MDKYSVTEFIIVLPNYLKNQIFMHEKTNAIFCYC